MARHMVSFAVVLLAAACLHSACAGTPTAAASTALSKDPKSIEDEYFNPSIRSVLGEGAHQPLSTGKVLTQIGEFEIVNEGPPDATGDIKAATPQFTASYVVYVNAVSGTTAEGDALMADGPYGMWSLDAEQRFFWMPASEDHKVTIEGRADFPKSVTIKGKFGGSSPAVATLGRIGTRGAMPRSFPINVRAPVACSYTWTSPDSGCNSVFTGKFSSTPSFAIKTNIGGFAYAGLYQDSLSFNKYAEVTCTIDPESAKVEPCPALKERKEQMKSEVSGDA